MLQLFYPSAKDWMWNYCTYLGPFVASDGSKYDLGIYKDAAAIVDGNEPGDYFSGELHVFGFGNRPKDAAYEETRRRASMLGLFDYSNIKPAKVISDFVMMSVDFGDYSPTPFVCIEEAIQYVKDTGYKNVRLKLTQSGSETTWDNF